jgi:hypothetical protein
MLLSPTLWSRTAISAGGIRKLPRLIVCKVLLLRSRSMQSAASFRNDRANGLKARIGVGGSGELSTSSSSEEGASLLSS